MRQPLGVVAAIMPFNFPAMMPLWHVGPALACGNAVVLKPSELDPTVPFMLAELFIEAGLPKGVFQVVNGAKEAVDALLDSEAVQGVSFVGSTPVAQYIYSRATANGKRAQCFGGAKNHMIVMPDADMDQAADALVGAGYGAAGERCMAVSVAVPVGEEAADRLIEKLVPRVEKLRVAPYTDGDDVDFGPVVTLAAKERILGMIESGVEQGAELVVDNRSFSLQGYESGYFVGPHLFDRVTPEMDIYRKEIFGPVLSTVRAGSYEEAGAGDEPRIRKRGGDLHPRRRRRPRLREPRQHRDGGDQRADSGSARLPHLRRLEEVHVRGFEPARAGRLQILHTDQDRDSPLAIGDQGRRRVQLQGDGLTRQDAGEEDCNAHRLYPGTFDPLTLGHIDVIRRAGALVDKLVIGVAANADKSPMFDTGERLAMIEAEAPELSAQASMEIEVRVFDSLLVHFAREVGASVIVRVCAPWPTSSTSIRWWE